jgi:hypothetical protein
MAKAMNRKPRRIVERNIALLDRLMRYLLAEPQIFSALPDNFELVILPEDDPEIRLYNLELLDRLGSEGKPIVFARIPAARTRGWKRARPHLYVPVAT